VIVLAACSPRASTEVAAPEPIAIVASPSPSEPAPEPEPAPAPAAPSGMDEIADLDADARWAWAVERMPELAEHAAGDRIELEARFAEWFPDEGRVFVRTADGKCTPVVGGWDGDVFVGKARERTRIEGKTKESSWVNVEIAPSGVVENGPHGITYTRNAKGKWEESGGWGIGCMDIIVDRSISAVHDDAIVYAGYAYTLTIECNGTRTDEQRCTDGTTRTCTTCATLVALQHADRMGFGHGRTRMTVRAHDPIDGTEPCPSDTVGPLVEPLSAIVKGRRFYGTTDLQGAVYRTRRACERDVRWKAVADQNE